MDPRPILKLNNQGVLFLGEEQYERAARVFRRAFKALKAEMIVLKKGGDRARTQPKNGTDEDHDHQEQPAAESVSETNRTKATETRDSESAKRRKRKHEAKNSESDHHDRAQENACRKRRKPVTSTHQASHQASHPTRSTSMTPDDDSKAPSEPLGRPLWLQLNNSTSVTILNLYASSIMYNYGYALHQLVTQLVDRKTRNRVRHEAMRVYGKAILLASQGNSPAVHWMACHNMQKLLLEILPFPNVDWEHVAFHHQALEERKTAILRSMTPRTDTGSSTGLSCLLVLSMLEIGGKEIPRRPAAAA